MNDERPRPLVEAIMRVCAEWAYLSGYEDLEREIRAAIADVERLRADLADMTADRDSWARQAADREQDALDLVAAERERCARLLDVEHERRKHVDNHAACYALMIRESK